MSNLILDGFDHYGTGSTGRTNMLRGVYAEVASVIAPSTVNPRTGACSLRCTGSVNESLARRSLLATKTTLFIEAAWYVTNTPVNSGKFVFAQPRTAANVPKCSFSLSATGAIEIREGQADGTLLATSAPGVFLPSVYQHVACMAHIDGANSSAEVRINGVVVCSVTGVNLGVIPIGGWAFGQTENGVHGTGDWYCDDMRVGDDQGGEYDDFVGDRRVILRAASRDGLHQEWTPDTGADAWARVDEVPPDGDASYIQSDTVGQLAQIGFEALPAGVVQVDAIAFVAYARKTDVGDASLRLNCAVGVSSPQASEQGAEHALNVAYNYLPIQVFDQNPDTAGPWSVSAADDAYCEIERTL